MNDKKRTEYAIKQVGERYFPAIVDKEAAFVKFGPKRTELTV